MTNFPSLVIKKALIKSWMNSLRTTHRWSIASLAGTYQNPAQKHISMAVENAEIQPARLKQKPGIQIDYFYVSFLTALILFCL